MYIYKHIFIYADMVGSPGSQTSSESQAKIPHDVEVSLVHIGEGIGVEIILKAWCKPQLRVDARKGLTSGYGKASAVPALWLASSPTGRGS